jgi:uncharacterized protein YndB with AHSA1/START domain
MSTLTLNAEPGSSLVSISRDFRATPEQLLRAHTDPGLLCQWIGPGTQPFTVEHFDARNGGTWRYYDTRDGENLYFHGVFHNEPSVESGVIQTFEFEGAPGEVSLERVTFEDLGNGATRLHATYTFLSVQYRDMLIEHGMEFGVAEGYRKLAVLLGIENG